jgi:protein gp37
VSTAIEWADETWNPATGCTKISSGCDHCYAERFAERFRGTPGHPYERGFDLQLRPERLSRPASWKRPRRVFVNSMSDLFHANVPDAFIHRVFDMMEATPRHTYQILTKRSGRMRRFVRRRYGHLSAPRSIWLGVSVETPTYFVRLDHLADTPCHVRFVSFEPLLADLGHLGLRPDGRLHWVIVGGESGPRARPIHLDWVRNIRDQCLDAGLAFFFKQWGGARPSSGGRVLDGRTWDEMPRLQGR